jgi:hypothetical protein
MNEALVESGESTLHQTMQPLKKGMSTVNVAVPDQSSEDSTNCPPEAFGSPDAAIGETREADSASKGK